MQKIDKARLIHWIAAISLAGSVADIAAADWQVESGKQWRPVDQSDLRVEPGSALDFSKLSERGPAGGQGYVITNKAGELAFADQPETPVRFLCCSEGMATFAYSRQEDIEAYADEVVRAGYNMFRPHFLDVFLMQGAANDTEFNPVKLDIWDRLSAALKKRGVYLYLDACTSTIAFSTKAPWDGAASQVPPWTLSMYWEDDAREHWRTGVGRLLSHVNPHTGVALKDEPQVAILQFRNEAGLGFRTFFFRNKENESNRIVTAHFRKWLQKKYATTDALRRAWTNVAPGGVRKEYLPADQTIESVTLPELYAMGPDTNDLYRFYTESERALLAWEKQTVEALGVRSIVLDFNNMHNLYSHLVRDALAVTDTHGYHSHPTNFDAPGSKIALNSLTETCGVELISMVSARQCGRPALCSEWGQPFWHPWRGAESGMVMSAYASLQGWQMLTQHGSPVKLSARRNIQPFTVATDPQAKAAERMAALMYRRGDVKKSPHLIQATLDAAAVIKGNPSPAFGMPESLTRLGLLVGFGTYVKGMPDATPRAPYKADIEFTPSAGGKLKTTMGVQSVEIDSSSDNRAIVAQEVDGLRRAGVLSAANRTDVASGIYESDTGEILLDQKGKQIQIRTQRSQGASLHAGKPQIELPNLQARTHGETVGVFAGSLDEQPLGQSKRVLLILATDALNSEMRFTDSSRTTLVAGGKLPVLVKTAAVDVTIVNSHASNMRLYALNLRGQRIAEIQLDQTRADRASAKINTTEIAGEPAVYFEFVAP